MEHYIHVFFENIWAASIIPFASASSLAAMKAFGGFNMPLAVTLAVLGATLGQMLNWLIGKLLLNLHLKSNFKAISPDRYEQIARLFNKYCLFILFFSWAPMFNTFVLIAGFLNTRLMFVLPVVFLGQVFNFGQLLL